jgi:hypothetical protein
MQYEKSIILKEIYEMQLLDILHPFI